MISIRGTGLVSPLGIGVPAHRQSWKSGDSGVDQPTLFDPGSEDARCGEVPEYDVRSFLRTRQNYLDRNTELACISVSEALRGFPDDRDRTGLVVSTIFGNVETEHLYAEKLLKKGPRFVSPVLFPHTYSNTTISLLAIEYGLGGFHQNFVSGAAGSISALILSCTALECGRCDAVTVCGVEALNRFSYKDMRGMGVKVPAEGSAAALLCAEGPGNGGTRISGWAFGRTLDSAIQRSLEKAGMEKETEKGVLLCDADSETRIRIPTVPIFDRTGWMGGANAVYSLVRADEMLCSAKRGAENPDERPLFCIAGSGTDRCYGSIVICRG